MPPRQTIRLWTLHAALLATIAYSLWAVGVCCDDFILIVHRSRNPPIEEWQATPVLIATHGLFYKWIGYRDLFLYDILKFTWVATAYWMIVKFGSLYFPPMRAALLAAAFLLYPSHDSTTFWYSTQYLILTASFYLYAFYLAAGNRLIAASLFAFLGSFVSYGSAPWAIGLCLIFALQKQYRQAAALLVPNLIYTCFYVVLTEYAGIGIKRLPAGFDALRLIKQFLLQLFGGMDAVLGPSIALKTWYSLTSLGALSAAVAAAIVLIAVTAVRQEGQERPGWPVFAGVAAIVLAGFAMFAVAGGYPQSAFGMGNRVTIYASFGLVFLLVSFISRPAFLKIFLCIIVAATIGISDHWRESRYTQDRTFERIAGQAALRSNELKGETVFVVGNAYSKLGPIAHIAFLTERWISDPVFELALGTRPEFQTVPLTSRFHVRQEGLLDIKHRVTYPVREKTWVFDAETGKLAGLDASELSALVEHLDRPARHWIQLIEIPWLRGLILAWLPQLEYLW